MNQDILLSKIVPNATETTWAQAYTTLNVYITLSIERAENKNTVTTYGKDLLEKLQREFFALDEKTLENIKNAVGNVSSTIDNSYNYSILVGAIVKDILYIVIASEGKVVIKRNGKVGVIATGVKDELHGFSGKLMHDDIVILETGDFDNKLPISSLPEHLESNDVLQIAENITPLIHGDSKGTESAIILQFKNLTDIPKSAQEDFIIDDEKEEKVVEKNDYESDNLWIKESKTNNNMEDLDTDTPSRYEDATPDKPKKSLIPKFNIPSINFASKKIIIGGVLILLIALLVGGITFQTNKANDDKKAIEFGKTFDPAKATFEEGVSLENLNKTLALEEYGNADRLVKSAMKNYDKSSKEYKQLEELSAQIATKISGIGGGGSAKNIKELVKATGDLKSITAITAKGGALLVLDKIGEQVATISDSGSLGKTYDINSNDTLISADKKYIYTMGSTATSIDRGNGKVTKITKSIDGDAFDIFGSNLYTLNSDDILKYRAPTYDSSSYFTEKVSFKSKPTDMSISGPIYVLEADGGIEKFTKGKKEDFALSGLAAPIGTGARLYTEPELSNIYVMDVKNQRVVVFNDEGEYQTQYEGSFIKGANSFAIDEENKIGYVLKSNTVYSFDL